MFACSMEIEREPDVTAIVSQRAERISGAAAELLRMIDALSRLYDDETLRRGLSDHRPGRRNVRLSGTRSVRQIRGSRCCSSTRNR